MNKLRSLTLLILAVWVGLVGFSASQGITADGSPAEPAAEKPNAEGKKAEAPKAREVVKAHAPEAKALLDQARAKLAARSTIQAQLNERISYGERRFEATGTYVAVQPPEQIPQTRLKFTLRVGDTAGELVEVCDGAVLRSLRTIRRLSPATSSKADAAGKEAAKDSKDPKSKTPKVKDEVFATRRDIQQIIKALGKADDRSEANLVAEMGLGGIPAILASLERTFYFVDVRNEQWRGKPVKTLDGHVNVARIGGILKSMTLDFNTFGPYVPTRVRLQLDAETLFPTRIVYLQELDNEGKTLRPSMTLEFTDVQLDQLLDTTDLFTLPTAAGTVEKDDTEEFEKMVRTILAAEDVLAGQK